MNKKIRVVFMGTPAFAVPSLKSILESHHEIIGVITAPDRPAGRGKKLRFSEIKKIALMHDLPLYQPEKLSNRETIDMLTSLKADVFVVVAFRMLPKEVWSIPELGTFNLHASLLPQYRGAAPIHWAIINGEIETGLTTFLIDDKIDTGAILLQKKIAIRKHETMGELSDRMQSFTGGLIIETLKRLTNGNISCVNQINNKSLLSAPKLTRLNTKINWSKPGKKIVSFIHGLNPFPSAWTLMDVDGISNAVKIHRAHFVAKKSKSPNGLINIENQELYVSVKDGVLYVDELQLPNKKAMLTASLLNGYQFTKNSRFL
jgi:methionyl-tRNA formyltransferase